jgi:hypothetical protein
MDLERHKENQRKFIEYHEYFYEVGDDEAITQLKSDWAKKKISNPTNMDYIIDEWIEELQALKKLARRKIPSAVVYENRLVNLCFSIKYMAIEHDITFQDILFADSDGIKRLLTHEHNLSDCEFWSNFSQLYLNKSDDEDVLKVLKMVFLTNTKKDRHCLMSEEEREFLNSLPDVIEIHRGMTVRESKSKEYGISWTLDKKIAEFFAYEYLQALVSKEKKTVVTQTIPKSEVIAYLNGREEQEILWITNKY